ncbi:MAG: sulfotransferase [Ruminiclostridium sp.]|nr:sulfotransferase [Ruminiclostridium sp.]
MPNLNALLARCIMAYRQGLNQPVPLLEEAGEASLKKLTAAYINASVSAEEQIIYNKVMHLLNISDNLRAQNLHQASENTLHEACRELKKKAVSRPTHLLCSSFILQAQAELSFDLKNDRRTRKFILKALSVTQLLEQDYSIAFLHILRLQQVLLYIRVCRRACEESLALQLCGEAISYLLGYVSHLQISKGWEQSFRELIPEPSRQALAAQFASEAGMILAAHPKEQAAEMFSGFHVWKHFHNQDPLKEIFGWGEMKSAYLNEDYTTFLTLCATFLKAGRKETLLWDTTVVDLYRCCQLLKPVQTADFLKEVAVNTENLRDVPPGGYSLPTQTSYKRIFVLKQQSYPSFVLPSELKALLLSLDPDRACGIDAAKETSGSIGASPWGFAQMSSSPRRFHAYNTGLPRSGCSSIMALFSNYNSVAEYKERESVELITAWKDGWISENTLRDYIRYRHEIGQLEMDTASFNHFYLHILVNEFPEAKFIFTIRDCYSWVNSFLRMISRWKKHFGDIGQEMPDWMLNYGRILFGEYDWNWFNSYEDLLRNLDPLVEMFIKSWADLNSRILELLPPERSLIVKTSEISRSQARISEFIGIPVHTLTEHHHINMAPDKVNLLQGFSREKFEALVHQYAKGSLLTQGL